MSDRGRGIPSAASMGVTFGPPVGEGWESFVQWRRPFVCECGYMGLEYWAAGNITTLICLKCGHGRRATLEQPNAVSGPREGEP